MSWTIASAEATRLALEVCSGNYQRGLVTGRESLSGSTLRGKAKSYGSHYARSRDNLLGRLSRAGLVVGEKKGAHGARLLVIMTQAEAAAERVEHAQLLGPGLEEVERLGRELAVLEGRRP